jgi:hypothetical protein
MTHDPESGEFCLECVALKAEIARLRDGLKAMQDLAKVLSHHAWDAHADYFCMARTALEGK